MGIIAGDQEAPGHSRKRPVLSTTVSERIKQASLDRLIDGRVAHYLQLCEPLILPTNDGVAGDLQDLEALKRLAYEVNNRVQVIEFRIGKSPGPGAPQLPAPELPPELDALVLTYVVRSRNKRLTPAQNREWIHDHLPKLKDCGFPAATIADGKMILDELGRKRVR